MRRLRAITGLRSPRSTSSVVLHDVCLCIISEIGAPGLKGRVLCFQTELIGFLSGLKSYETVVHHGRW